MCQASYDNSNNQTEQNLTESKSDLLSEIKKFNGLKNWQQEVKQAQQEILESGEQRD